jgi:uncharacterized membrane protein YeaQ/YmgE (transglycosylase-associated protein family)
MGMSFFVWLVLGVVIGYLGSLIMRTDPDQGILTNALVGSLGALTASWLLAPRLSVAAEAGGLSLDAFLVSLLGAVVLVAVVDLFRRRRVR